MSKKIALYAPAIHKGYLDFFKRHEGLEIGVLSLDVVREQPRLDRDIRAIGGELVVRGLAAMTNRGVYEVTPDNIDTIYDDTDAVVMPDEDVSRKFAADYLEPRAIDVEYDPVFLRWDRPASTMLKHVEFGEIVGLDQRDLEFMKQARDESFRSKDWWRQIGSIIVTSDGEQIISHNHTLPSPDNLLETFGDPRSNFDAGEYIELQKNIHAEASAIATAARVGMKLEDGRIYVTTFPCPPCARLIVESGIKTVYYQDGYSLLDANGILTAAGVRIVKVLKTNQLS
jgi:dCMP deaminase